MSSLRKLLWGWGRFPQQECITWRPEIQSGLVLDSPMISHGLGRSYGDAALNEMVTSFLPNELIASWNSMQKVASYVLRPVSVWQR